MNRQSNFSASCQTRLLRFLPVIAVVFCCLLPGARAQNPPAAPVVLTNAADVLSLPVDQARKKLPVFVRGIVTAAEPTWRGQFFVQDETSGIFVENKADDHPEPGDLIEVRGLTQPGAFAPIISKPTWTIIGTAPLPRAKRVTLEQLMSGLEDGQRVEITGTVRAVSALTTALDIEIASGGNRIHMFRKRPADFDPQSLIGARVQSAQASWQLRSTLRRR